MTGVRWLSKQEMDSIIDQRSRKVLGISGKEFMRRIDEFSTYNEKPYVPGLMELLMLAIRQ
jgi:hypothetical protein